MNQHQYAPTPQYPRPDRNPLALLNQNIMNYTDTDNYENQDGEEEDEPDLSHHTTPEHSPVDTAAPISAPTGPVKRGRKGLATERTWAHDEKVQLIDLWGQREILYNSSHKDYSNKLKKDQLMAEIATEMNLDKEVIAKQMVSLKSYYGQLKSKYEASLRSGSGDDDIQHPQWIYYESLNFLKDNVTVRTTVSNRSSASSSFSSTSSSGRSKNLGKSDSLNNSISESNSLIKEAITQIGSGKRKTIEDDDATFGDLIASNMRKIREGLEKEELKIEIQALILAKRRQMNL